jgi:hypothetical protein
LFFLFAEMGNKVVPCLFIVGFIMSNGDGMVVDSYLFECHEH